MWRRAQRATRPFHAPQRCESGVLASLVLILATALLLLVYSTKGKPSSPSGILERKANNFRTSAQSGPSLEFMNGTNLIWQIPDAPKAVLFLAHGCNGKAANFWDKSPGCPDCVGLPEERLIVLNALSRRFAVLAVSSTGRCWSFGKEKEAVKWIIKWWIEKHGLEKLPVVALGASSGGYFVSALAAEMEFSSIVLMIAEGVFETMGVPNGYPPTLFVHMPKDRIRMNLIEANIDALREKGVRVKEIKCMEFPLSPTLLSDRISGLEETISVNLYELFRERGFIDEKGYMRKDGRATRWKQVAKERKSLLDKHELLDHIQEELNLAFGYHEMTSMQSDDILDWFESHMH